MLDNIAAPVTESTLGKFDGVVREHKSTTTASSSIVRSRSGRVAWLSCAMRGPRLE